MFNGLGGYEKHAVRIHPSQQRATDNYFININKFYDQHFTLLRTIPRLSAAPFYSWNLITEKEPFSYLGFSETSDRLENRLSQSRLYRHLNTKTDSIIIRTRMILFTYVTTRNAFEKIPPTVFCSFDPKLLSLFTTSSGSIPAVGRTRWFLWFTYH